MGIKVLVLSQYYPKNNASVGLTYIRTRNVYYSTHGIHVEVINFASKSDYVIDGIEVHPLKWFNKKKATDFDLLICHAPNLKSHYLFLTKYAHLFDKKVFFFHGHEVLKINEVYSKPYPYINQSKIKVLLQNIYDNIKLTVWRQFFEKNAKSSYCIFVSNWMRNEFYKWTKINPAILANHEYITYNSVGEVFENEHYDNQSIKKYDFITIRAVLDGSKYGVDIVNNLAYQNPNLNFLLIGRGEFFDHYKKAPNITWLNTVLTHHEMCEYMDMSKCALMPTRTDAQGVMMCEMSAYGMPLITSDIPVCHEVFGGVPGVAFLDNEMSDKIPLAQMYEDIKEKAKKELRYAYSKVCSEELNIIKKIYES